MKNVYRKQFGITIIELMIAMVLGLMLMAGISKIYITTKDSYNLSENVARLQENARFAMGYLIYDIRRAGFIPCKLGNNVNNTLDSTDNFLDFFNGAITGYDGSAFPAGTGFPAVGTNAGDRAAGTDAAVILGGGDETYKLDWHNGTSATLRITDLHTLANGDIILMCDGETATIFQVTNVNAANKQVTHQTGGAVSPGNCSQQTGGSGCDCSDATCFEIKDFGPESQLVKFEGTGYYIGISITGDSRSLYRLELNVAAGVVGFPNEELIVGIENMQILYGEDTDNDGQIENYFTADNVTTWNDVFAVRLGLLTHTPDQINKINDTNTYMVAGTQIADTATAVTHDGDRRLRRVFTSTIKIRNQGL